ncbi:S8 family serine peptidase [Draconibacterium mangrovi]|uniref:S8 family serine peptidase n=1 Tax=Draconibacterium mangrovi TaxID=2697469 RepID=UPI0013D29054|nr:S8 family serine peptidase [Draconibacterium mangrovi]
MKKLQLKILVLFFAGALIYSCNDTFVSDENADDTVELKSASSSKNSYIVVLNDADLTAELAQLKGYEKKQNAVKVSSAKILERAGITDGEIGHVYGTALKGFSVKIAPGQLKKLENDASVAYIEQDKVIALAPPPGKGPNSGGGDTGGGTTAQETPWGISRVGGADDGTGKVAWIIDSGIDQDHPDLNVDKNRSETFLGGKSTPDDQNGHGTHVAGTIAAIDNSEGVVGVAAGATVVAVRVLDRRGSGTVSGVVAGVNYVAANASSGDVANMSLGGGVSTTLDNAVLAASSSCTFVLAAGNESDDANNHSPARIGDESTKVYTISACDSNDDWAYFSNYGSAVDYCAPGYRIKSTWKDGGYNTISGTSMAAPHAAGVLLMGPASSSGTVNGDPDNDPDPIIHL